MRELRTLELAMVAGGCANVGFTAYEDYALPPSGGGGVTNPASATVNGNTYGISVSRTTPSGQPGVAVSVTGTFSDLGSWAPNFAAGMSQIGQNVVDTIVSIYNSVSDFISSVIDYVSSMFSGIGSTP